MVRSHFILAALLLVAGCGYDSGTDPPPPPVQPTLVSIQREVFAKSCTFSSCHNPTKRAEMMDLSSEDATCASLLGVPSTRVAGRIRLVRGSPQTSYLMNKLNDTLDPSDRALTPPEGGGRSMPWASDQTVPTLLSADRLSAISTWIENGAQGCDDPMLMDGAVLLDAAVVDGGFDAALHDAGASDGAADAATTDGAATDGSVADAHLFDN